MTFNFKSFTSNAQHFLSDRIALRPLTLADAWPLWAATQTPKFMQHLLWDPPKSPEEVIARVRRMLASAEDNRLAPLSAVCRNTGEWVGLLRLFPELSPGPTGSHIEAGLWTHPHFWHGSYSEEYARLVRDAAFVTTDVPCLVARVAVKNRAAQTLMGRVGLLAEDPVEMQCEAVGQSRPGVKYRITRERWEAIRHQHPFQRY